MKIEQELDDVLDEALAAYRDAEPLAGLEERVLGRVLARTERRRWISWGYCSAAALAAAIALVFWLGIKPAQQQRAVPGIVTEKPLTDAQAAAMPQTAHGANRPMPAGHKAARPVSPALASARPGRHWRYQQQFPIPEPLTADERALLALANADPTALQTLPHNDVAIVIAPIKIAPLAADGADGEGEN